MQLSKDLNYLKLESLYRNVFSFHPHVFFVIGKCFPNLFWGRGTFPLGVNTEVNSLLGNSIKWPHSHATPTWRNDTLHSNYLITLYPGLF